MRRSPHPVSLAGWPCFALRTRGRACSCHRVAFWLPGGGFGFAFAPRPRGTSCATSWLSLCPTGSERSLGAAIEAAPPTRLCMRPSWHSPACGPSLFPSFAGDARSGPESPPAGLAARFPHAPVEWLLSPAGRISPPPTRCAMGSPSSSRIACNSDLPHLLPRYGRGAFHPPVPRAEECAAAAAGETQGRTASHPRDRHKSRHAVRGKKTAGEPRGRSRFQQNEERQHSSAARGLARTIHEGAYCERGSGRPGGRTRGSEGAAVLHEYGSPPRPYVRPP